MLMGPREGVCEECAAEHPDYMPHSAQSLYYQYRFYQQNGRWPTWNDAMAHCSERVKAATLSVLARNNVDPFSQRVEGKPPS